MDAASLVRGARKAAGLTQRDLAKLAGVAQPTVARIERSAQIPRADMLDRLLRATGFELVLVPTHAPEDERGVDRSLIREYLRLTPRERAEQAAAYGRAAERLRAAAGTT